ncbi:MAG: HEAT repeat domain-containing protein [Planctomycetota bacterium]|jgi:HEAT repeat protein
MNRLRPLLSHALVVTLLAACSTTGSGTFDPEIEEAARLRQQEAAEAEARLAAPDRLITDLDKALHNYSQLRLSGASPRAEATAEKVEKFLVEQSLKHFDMLIRQANEAALPRNRAIAVAALGFSGRAEALDPLVNAAQEDDPEVVANAVFGLAMLSDRRTPPAVVIRVVRNESFDETVRNGAAWTLLQLQQAIVDPTEIVRVWLDLLERPAGTQPAGVLVSAVRGIGLTRDAAHAPTVIRLAADPTPLVRQAVAIALARMGAQDHVETLLALLGPGETNENVRLAARKALQELAGGADRKYDVEEWKRVFERGS